MKKEYIIIGIILLFLLGMVIGKTVEYYSNDFCEIQEKQYSACVNGCELADTPLNRYDTCVMFCEQQYYILEDDNQCTWLHKMLR